MKSFEECYHIVVPKYFSPNGDGINERWVIDGLEDFPESKITLYDRFGKFIITYLESDDQWDGKQFGKQLPSDDYWYVIEVVPFGIILKGNVNLKR